MLTTEQIQDNWYSLKNLIHSNFKSPRKEKLDMLYDDYADDLIIAPASANINYHNCFPGGYIDHVLRVVKCADKLYHTWKELGADMSTFTYEELMFAAINHDLGKAGDINKPYYIHNPSDWHRKNQGQHYEINGALTFMKVPDRSLYILQKYEIPISENEYLAIKLHDGMYSEANKGYYMAVKPEFHLKSNISIILHHADHLASRIEADNKVSTISNTTTPKISKDKNISGGELSAEEISKLFSSQSN